MHEEIRCCRLLPQARANQSPGTCVECLPYPCSFFGQGVQFQPPWFAVRGQQGMVRKNLACTSVWSRFASAKVCRPAPHPASTMTQYTACGSMSSTFSVSELLPGPSFSIPPKSSSIGFASLILYSPLFLAVRCGSDAAFRTSAVSVRLGTFALINF